MSLQPSDNSWPDSVINTNESLEACLIRSVKNKDKDTLQKLLDKCKNGSLPLPIKHIRRELLNIAASNECLELLLQYRESIFFDIDKEWHGRTPLLTACEHGFERNVSLLVQAGCDPYKTETLSRNSPLHFAAGHGHSNIVEYLVNYPENINKGDTNGVTPLHLAARMGHLETSRILILHGANVLSETEGYLPLHLACKIENLDVIQLLLEHDSTSVNHQNSRGQTPMMLAIANRSGIRNVKLLYERGGKTNIYDKYGKLVLHYAVTSGNVELLQYVLQRTERSSIEEWFSNIPRILETTGMLHSLTCCAIYSGSMESLQILLSSDKLSKCILQAPSVHKKCLSNEFQVYSPLAMVLSDPVHPSRKVISYLQLLLKHEVATLDDFYRALKMEWRAYGVARYQCPFSRIADIAGNQIFSEQCYLYLIANDITIDYCLQNYHNVTEPFATFTDYDTYYEPVVDMVLTRDCNVAALKLIMSSSVILEPDRLLAHANEKDMRFSDIIRSEPGLNITRPNIGISPGVIQYLVSLKPIYIHYNVKDESYYGRRLDNPLIKSHFTVTEQFANSTLKQLCRTAIRQHLREYTLEDNLRNFRRKILELPLPTSLKDYLLFKS